MNPRDRREDINQEIDNETLYCYHCSVDLKSESDYSLINDEPVCEDCHHERYTNCYECEEPVPNDDTYYSDYTSEYYCSDCYWENHTECYECGEQGHFDAMVWHEPSDDYYCDDCVPRKEHPDWNVYSNSFVQTNDHFVNPRTDGYIKDTFKAITSKRYVGLEVEVNNRSSIDYYDTRDELSYVVNDTRDKRITRAGGFEYTRRLDVVNDSSVTSSEHPNGCEIVLQPRRGDIMLKDLKSSLDYMYHTDNYYVSVKCGLHLHVDTRDYDWKHFAVLSLFTKLIEPYIYNMVPSSRYEGRWSKPVSQSMNDFAYIEGRDSFIDFWYDNGSFTYDKYNSKRYHGLNLHSHFQANQGTEIRYHSGTMNYSKIKHWIILWTNIIDKCYDIAERLDNSTFDSFGETSIYESLVRPPKSIYDIIKRYSINEVNHYNIDQYYKDSELLRRYLKLEKLDKPYIIQPMLDYVTKHRHKQPMMSLSDMFELFEIPYFTQKYIKTRMRSLRVNNERSRAFDNVTSIVKFDADKLVFKYVDNFSKRFATIDNRILKGEEGLMSSYDTFGYLKNNYNIYWSLDNYILNSQVPIESVSLRLQRLYMP